MKTNTKKMLAAVLTLAILGSIGLSLTQNEWLKGRFTSRIDFTALSNSELAEGASDARDYAEAYADQVERHAVTAQNAYESGEAESLANAQADTVEKAEQTAHSAELAGKYAKELFSRYEEQAQAELDELLTDVTDMDGYVADLAERYTSVLEEYGLALEEYEDYISIEKPDYGRTDVPIVTETDLYETYASEYEEYIEIYVELTYVLESMADEEVITDYLESMDTYESRRSTIVDGFAEEAPVDALDTFLELGDEIIETKFETSGFEFNSSYLKNLRMSVLDVELASEDTAEIILGYYMSANEDYLAALSYARNANDTAAYVLSLTIEATKAEEEDSTSKSIDTDNDGLYDDEETTYGTDPNDKDTDDDGLSDYEEIKKYNTDPLDPDTDNDGMDDGTEITLGTDPLVDSTTLIDSSTTDSSSSNSGSGGSNSSSATTSETLTDDEYVCDEPFVDVLDSDWHQEIVCRMYVANVVNGRTEELFEPNDTLTRAEAIKMISILLLEEEEEEGEDLTEDFEDVVSSDWYRDFIAIAQDANVIRVNDFGDYFYPNNPISRGDLALYVVRALELTSYSFDLDYTDVDEDDYFAYAIAILSESETDVPYDETEDEVPVLSGYEDDSFRPTSNITRAEALAMIYRAYLAYIAD